jgi:L-rhamnose-H+ transport protein
MSLGMAVALGYCAAFGTLMPPLFHGEFGEILNTTSGLVILGGVGICLAGIVVAGIAGMSKEKEMPEEQKKAAIKEFNFIKGLLVATFSGIMSASMSYGLNAAEPIAQLSAAHGTPAIWTGLPKLVVVLLGGFTSNFIWCVLLNIKNKTGHEYFSAFQRVSAAVADRDLGSGGTAVAVAQPALQAERVPMLGNYFFSALAGTTWYMQFFFYTMGETQMGEFKFSSWTLHMASIIIFSTLWGVALHEWRGSSKKTHWLIAFGLFVLIVSTVVVGYGNYLKPTQGKLLATDSTKLVVNTGDDTKKEETTFTYDSKTVVLIAGQAGKVAEIKPGQTVLIEATKEKVATKVLARPMGK